MDRTNAIIVCIMFGAWIRKILRISLKGFGTIRRKIRHFRFFVTLILGTKPILIPGTKLIEVCCGLFETLDLDWSSPSTLSARDLVSEGRVLYSSPLF